MNFICGSNALATPATGTGGISGTVELTAPFIIPGSGQSVTSLACTDSLIITAVLSESDTIEISAYFADFYNESAVIPVQHSGMDSEYVSSVIPAVSGLDSSLKISADLTENKGGVFSIINTLGDYAYSGDLEMKNTLGLTGLAGCFMIALPQSTGQIMDQSLTIYGDGAEITKYLRNAEIDVYKMSVKAEFEPFINMGELTVHVDDEVYTFEVSGGSSSPEASVIFGKAKTSTTKINLNSNHIRGSELAAEFSDIIWQAPEIVLTDISGSYTGSEIAKLIAEGTGFKSRVMPDGRSLIYNDDSSNTTYTPEYITDWQKEFADLTDTFTEVLYGRSGDRHITIEPETSKKQTGGKIKIRIYGASSEIITNANLTKISSGISETVTENIIFEKGAGRLSKPAYEVITAGVSAYGKDLLTDSSVISRDVTYKTKYDTYELSSKEAGQYTLFALLNNRVFFIKGDGAVKKTIYAPHLTDYVSAIRLAEKLHRKEGAKLTLTTTHSNIINTTSGLNISTPYGSGAVTGAKINIQGNPVKITDRLEVLQWQK